MKRIILAVLLLVVCATPSFADTSIKAEVDKPILTTDETLIYKIVVTSTEKKLPQPQIPQLEGFKIISQASSSTASFLKSEIKSILVFAFILSPLEVGKFEIKPATIKIGDKVYSSQAFDIEVKQLPTGPGGEIPESTEPQINL